MAEAELEISTRAFCKLFMHSLKYPSSSINGVLLARREDMRPGQRTIRVTDCIPLFHLGHGLTPMLEVALSKIEFYVEEAGLVIAGLYHANENVHNNNIDVFTQRVADKINENQPGSLLVTIPNQSLCLRHIWGHEEERLDWEIAKPDLIVYHNIEGKWKLRDKPSLKYEHGNKTLLCASHLLKDEKHKILVDFDNYLDDISQDYLNNDLNMKIDTCVSSWNCSEDERND